MQYFFVAIKEYQTFHIFDSLVVFAVKTCSLCGEIIYIFSTFSFLFFSFCWSFRSKKFLSSDSVRKLLIPAQEIQSRHNYFHNFSPPLSQFSTKFSVDTIGIIFTIFHHFCHILISLFSHNSDNFHHHCHNLSVTLFQF